MTRFHSIRPALLIAALTLSFALAGCDSLEQGIEAGQMAAATVEHMATQANELLGETPPDAEAARSAVAGAVEQMTGELGDNSDLVQAVLAVIAAKVSEWNIEGGDQLVERLTGLQERLASGEVEDVQGAVQELVEQIRSGADDA